MSFDLIKLNQLQELQKWGSGTLIIGSTYKIYTLTPHISETYQGFLLLNGLEEKVRKIIASNLLTRRQIIFSAETEFELLNLVNYQFETETSFSTEQVVNESFSERATSNFINNLQKRNIIKNHWPPDCFLLSSPRSYLTFNPSLTGADTIAFRKTSVTKIREIRIRIE